jgi:hypothetical protein
MTLFISGMRTRARVGLLSIMLAAAAGGSGCSDQKTRFAGIWKSNCDDYWGVLIAPAGDALYSIMFCGLSGCMKPGEWAPNTDIENDPMYQVVSAKKLRIKSKKGGYFTYTQCNSGQSWPTAP